MNLWITKVCFILLTLMLCMKINSQEAIISSGNTISGEGGSISYSLGQIAFNSYFNEAHSLTEGVQQLLDDDLMSAKDLELFSDHIKMYPNPVEQELQITSKIKDTAYQYEILDLEGKIYVQGNLKNLNSNIDVSQLRQGIYFIVLKDTNNNNRTFKIIKL